MHHTHYLDLPLGRVAVSLHIGLEPGPLALIVAGQHGDEPTPVLAAGELHRCLRPRKGAIVIVHNANPAGLALGTRYAAREVGGGDEDMNRVWSTPIRDRASSGAAEHARALSSAILRLQVSYQLNRCATAVIDLHERGPSTKPNPEGVWVLTPPTGDSPDLVPPGVTVLRADVPGSLISASHVPSGLARDLLLDDEIRAIAVETCSRTLERLEQIRAYVWIVGYALQAAGLEVGLDAGSFRWRA